MITYPNAKINIGLNVVEKRKDGYHNLETIFYPINLLDAVEIKTIQGTESENGYQLKVSGTVLDGGPDDNLVVKAYKKLKKDFQLPPINIFVYKHIPTGAGLGGGSADAAFTIKMLDEMFNLGLSTEKMEEYASEIGADCAFFIKNKPAFATGIGNEFKETEVNLKGKYILLVKPDIFVSTKDAYANVVPQKPEYDLNELVKQPIGEWKKYIKNDFEASVFQKYPEIAAIKDKMYDIGAEYSSMSGSGSAVYGIFNDAISHVEEIFAGYFCRLREL